MTATLEKWYHKKWYVVCVKDARGYTKGQPMMGYFETHEDATARAAAMSNSYPGCFVAMPGDEFHASMDDESVLNKYLPQPKLSTP